MRELTPDDFTTTPLDFLTAVRGPFAFPLPASAGEGPPAGGLLTFAGGQIGIFDPSIEWGIDVLNIWNARSDALTAVKDIFSAFGHWVWGFIGGVGRFVFNGIGDAIVWLSGVTARVGGDVVGWISSAGQWVWDHVRGGLGDVNVWSSSVGSWVWGNVQRGFGDVTSWVSSSATWVWDHVRGGFGDVNVWSSAVGSWVWTNVQRGLGDVNSWASAVGSWVWGKVQTGLGDVNTWVSGAAQWLWGKTEPAIAGAADAIAGGLLSGFQWLVTSLFGNIPSTLGDARGFYHSLIAGQAGEGADFVDNVLSFLDSHGLGILGAAMVFFGAFPAVVDIFTESGRIVSAPALQLAHQLHPYTLPSAGMVVEARHRGLIDGGHMSDVLSRYGFDGSVIDMMYETARPLPGAGDVVTLAGRHAFDPDAAAAVGFISNAPNGMRDAMTHLGFADEWTDRYWWAHWSLPNVAGATEMWWRGAIDERMLRAHIDATGYPPVWRDAYMNVAHLPYSRIDLRRMYKIGVLTEDDVHHGYMQIGYDDAHARALTEFTKRYYAPEDQTELDTIRKEMGDVIRQAYRRRLIDHTTAVAHMVTAGYVADDAAFRLSVDDLYLAFNPGAELDPDLKNVTVAMITTAYGDGVMSRADAQRALENMGFMPAGADIALSLVDHRTQADIVALEVEVVHQEYLSNALTDAAAGAQLQALQLDIAHVELTVRKWQLEKSKKTARLSLAQVVAAYHMGKLTGDQVLVELATLGYSGRDVDILLTLGTADLTLAEIMKARKKGVFTDAQTLTRLLAKGYTAGDADVLLAVA
jgi:hypothetical protein